jgi:hypothetical protein
MEMTSGEGHNNNNQSNNHGDG